MNARRIRGRGHGTRTAPAYGMAGGVVTQADLSGGTVTAATLPEDELSLATPAGWTVLYLFLAVAFLFVFFVRK